MSRKLFLIALILGWLLNCGLPAQAYNSSIGKIFSDSLGTRAVNTATNGILTVSIESTTGQFTITTGASHPKPGQTVLYPIGTSYITLRDATSSIMWFNYYGSLSNAGLTGYTAQSMLATAPVTTALGTTGFRTTYTIPNYRIVQDVVITGTNLANTNVKHAVSVTNTSAAARTYGLRYMWDWQIAGNDASLFRTRNPDGTFTSSFSTFTAPAFKLYEEVDNAITPAFSIFGSTRDLPLSPVPTLPEQVRYCSWQSAVSSAWDFTNTGSGSDSAVCYYWGFTNPLSLAAGATATYAQYVTTQLEAISPAVTITKSAPATITSGSNLTYTLTYGNTGTAAATGVVIQDTLPTGTTFVSATGGGTLASGVVTWNVGDIPANTTGRTVTFTVRVTATTGSISNATYSIKGTNTGTAFGTPVTTTITVPTGVAPTVTINPPGPVVFASCTPITFLVTGTDPDTGAQITLTSSTLPTGATMTPALPRTGATGVNSRFNWTPDATQAGNYTLTFTARDQTGLVGTKTFVISRDITAPIVAITTPAFKASINALPSIAGTVSDAGAGAKAPTLLLQRLSDGQYWSGSAWGVPPANLATVLSGANWSRTTALPATTNLADGAYHIAVIASDNVGNTAGALSYFTVDKTVPASVTFIAPTPGSTVNSLPLVYGATSDNAGGSGIARVVFSLIRASDSKYWSGSATTGWVATSTILRATVWPVSGGASVNWSAPANGYVMPTGTNLPNGSYTLRATSYDVAGNATAASISVTVNSSVVTPYLTAK